MTLDGRITDAMTVVAIQRVALDRLTRRGSRVVSTDRRDWDVIVVGLGAIGSAAAYWASTRPGTRVLGLERFELGHANGASADHSRIIRLSYHRPDYVRLAKRAFETGPRSRREAGERIVTVTGGLDLWPADPRIPMVDYTASLAAEAVPFEILDAAEVMRRWPQWHLADDVTAMWQSQGGLADPYRGNAAHRRLAVARGATLRGPHARHGDPRRSAAPTRSMPAGPTHTAGRVILAADAWTNELLAAFDCRLPLTVTKEQVTYFAAPGSRRLRTGPLPGLDLDGRTVLLRLPDLRRGRTQGRPGRRRRSRRRRDDPHVRARRGRCTSGCGDSSRPTCRARPGRRAPHEDLPVHAHPGSRLRRGPACPDAPGVVVGLGRRARLQVRVRARSRPRRARPRRGVAVRRRSSGAFRIDRPILLERDPATSWLV